MAWHPEFVDGKDYAESFFSYFNREKTDPLSRGIGIPVYYRTGDKPIDIDLTNSMYNAIILLISSDMVVSKTWANYIDTLVEKINVSNGNSIIYPVAITKSSFKISSKLSEKNFIRLYEKQEKIDFLLSRTTHELCRLLYGKERLDDISQDNSPQSPPSLKLFISHAKEDGVDVAKQLSIYLQSETALKTFFDSNDIAIGYEFAHVIEANIKDSVLLVIHSDKYSSREWCRKEVILAKKHNRPIVVVNLYNEGEDRSFPYMANLKIIRFNQSLKRDQMFEKIIFLTLKETLRFKYQQMYIQYFVRKLKIEVNIGAILSYPPELLSLLFVDNEKNKFNIYPDPPLSEEEIEILSTAKSDSQFITPTFLPLIKKIAEHKYKNINFLQDRNIGISISESQNISELGLEHSHLQDALVEFARYLLVCGANLSYGGDVRYDKKFNFAKILFDLGRNYIKDKKPADKINNYVAYPLNTLLDSDTKADLEDIANFIEVFPSNEFLGNPESTLETRTLFDQYIWSRSLTNMREVMNASIDARIIIGGKTKGYKGKYPGVVEEAFIAISSNKPVYLIGSMGGAAKAVVDCLCGKNPIELTEEYQFDDIRYRELYNFYNEQATKEGLSPINYGELSNFFNEKGINSLNNGLSEEENEKLFATTNVTEMISLVLNGLEKLYPI